MIQDLVKELESETVLAIEHKNGTKQEEENAVKVPEFHKAMGAIGRTLAVNLSDDSFKEFGLDESDIVSARTLGAKLRTFFVETYGDVSTGFNSKKGTSIVQTLKNFQGMAESGVYPLAPVDLQAISEALTSWYENAPLRGRASKVKNGGKDDAVNVEPSDD